MSTYLVTGCAGFIGSNLCERLLKDGHTVIGVDDVSTGTEENLDLLRASNEFKFLRADISDKEFTQTFIQYLEDYYTAALVFHDEKIDCVFHMAALARIQPAIQNPVDCLNRNVFGLMNVLEMMRQLKIKNIVFSSSSSVYGLKNKSNLPLQESYEPDCLNQYSWSKLAGEHLIKVYCNLYDIRGVSLRYFNVYGPREVLNCGEYSPVLGLFYQQVLKNKQPMTIVGDGLQTRDMTHVFDVVEANWLASEKMSKGTSFKGDIFNVGTGRSISILDLAKTIQELLKKDGIDCTYVHVDPRPGEARSTQADISKSVFWSGLGWNPKVSFLDGLMSQKEYYLKKYGFTQKNVEL